MPWHVADHHSACPMSEPFAVINETTGDLERGGCHATREEANRHMAALYANVPDAQRSGAVQHVEILQRSDAAVLTEDVDFKQRIIDVIAVPYDQEAEVPWRGEVWREVFDRNAFRGIEDHAGRVPVRREHTVGGTIGRVIRFVPSDPRGLLTSIKVARTLKGDETLQLAAEDMLGASIGYFVKKPSDVDLNRRSMLRRVKRAFLEHLAMTDIPAFAGAETVAVREGLSAQPAAGETPLVTPVLDSLRDDEIFSWAASRVSRQ